MKKIPRGALAEMQTKYEAQKKENIIAGQKFDLERKNYLFYGALLLMLFGIILIPDYF
ncbi:MAG: hypothetical protein WDO19_23825 [Bacteroidota bacterium]